MEPTTKEASALSVIELKAMKSDHMDQIAFAQNQINIINAELMNRAKAVQSAPAPEVPTKKV